jgi:hypothetical protein
VLLQSNQDSVEFSADLGWLPEPVSREATGPAGRYFVVEDQPAQKITKTPAQKIIPPKVGEMGTRTVPTRNPPYPITRA